jgi:signal transduction histidine kinase
MRRVPIRMKLAAALTVPLLGLFVITAIEVTQTARNVDRVRSQTELARAAIGPTGVLTKLQNERTWAVVDLIGTSGQITSPVSGYDATRKETDEAIASFRDTLDTSTPAVASAYRPALDMLSQLADLRASIDASTGAKNLTNVPFADSVFTGYSDLIRPFFDADTRVALAVDDAQLRQWTTLVGATNRQNETVANLARSTILIGVIGDGINKPDEIATIADLKATLDRLNSQFAESPEPYATVVDRAFPTDLVEGMSAQVEAGLAGGRVELDPFLAALNVPADAGFMGLRDQLTAELNHRADTLDSDATQRERIYIAMAVVTLAAAIILSWLVSRSITRPLRSLTRQAKDMAENRLPDAVTDILETPLGEDVAVPHVDPVRVATSDEVGDVATALNTVQDTALDLAIEQAVLRRNIADSFVNLGRRNQHLLGRQLDFITELESNETDPDALANLFRLDHLATRMRRNAESLLVLAGFDPPRKWAAPVRLTDVIRAALGEVEDYHRVAVRGVEPATILGSAAADLAHLLAELVENALVFSPPDQAVDIRGRHRNDGPLGHSSYTLAVIDTGLGMPSTDISAANRRLAGAESFTIAPSKYLGHYVAGNLASRHGIRVHLDNSPGNGVTATITLPPELLTTEAVLADPVTPPHGQRAVRLLPGVVSPEPRDLPIPGEPPAALGRPRPAPLPATTPYVTLPMPPEPGPTGLPPRLPTRTPGNGNGHPGPGYGRPPVGPLAPPPAPTPGPLAPEAPAARDGGPRLPQRGGQPGAIPVGPITTGSTPIVGEGEPPPPGLWPRSLAAGARREGGGKAIPTNAQSGARPDDQTLLAALGRYVPPGVAPPGGPQGPGGPGQPPVWPLTPAGGTPASPFAGGASPFTPAPPPRATPSGLTRRVRGAQLPETHVVPLRGDGPPAAPPPGGLTGGLGGPAPGPRVPPASHAAASSVQALLASFTAGVERGLDEARQRADSRAPNGREGH